MRLRFRRVGPYCLRGIRGARGNRMQEMGDDCGKRRLTERAEMITAVDFLHARGFTDEELPTQLSRFYYIDVDLLNDVVRAKRPLHGPRRLAS